MPELGRSLQQYIPLLMGAVLLLVVYVFPEGIAGLIARLAKLGKRLWTRPKLASAVLDAKEPSGEYE